MEHQELKVLTMWPPLQQKIIDHEANMTIKSYNIETLKRRNYVKQKIIDHLANLLINSDYGETIKMKNMQKVTTKNHGKSAN